MARQHSTPAPDRTKAPSSAARKTPDRGSAALILQRMDAAPQTIRPADILHLQRAIGNRATARIVQAKLKLGPAGDKYEQEADRVAQQVVRASRQPDAQRESVDKGNLQAKPLADRISQVRRAYLATAGVQREGMEEEELQASPKHGLEGGDVDTDVARSIESAKGGGAPLHDGVRSSMERGFGADFGGVRVHTGGQADALNRSLNAKAFTTGKDIFFGNGEYNPGSTGGQELIAHELTHTVQQGGAGVQRTEESNSAQSSDISASVSLPVTVQQQAPQNQISAKRKKLHLDFVRMKRNETQIAKDILSKIGVVDKPEDAYGHWWTEVGDKEGDDWTPLESYGWWPSEGVADPRAVVAGVPGDLNGQIAFDGSAHQDPHHDEEADTEFHPVMEVDDTADYSEIRQQVTKGIRDFATGFKGTWNWRLGWGKHCHTFQQRMKQSLGMHFQKGEGWLNRPAAVAGLAPSEKIEKTTRRVYQGRTIRYGHLPTYADQEMTINADKNVWVVWDEAFISQHKAVPVDLTGDGSELDKYIYVPERNFRHAMKRTRRADVTLRNGLVLTSRRQYRLMDKIDRIGRYLTPEQLRDFARATPDANADLLTLQTTLGYNYPWPIQIALNKAYDKVKDSFAVTLSNGFVITPDMADKAANYHASLLDQMRLNQLEQLINQGVDGEDLAQLASALQADDKDTLMNDIRSAHQRKSAAEQEQRAALGVDLSEEAIVDLKANRNFGDYFKTLPQLDAILRNGNFVRAIATQLGLSPSAVGGALSKIYEQLRLAPPKVEEVPQPQDDGLGFVDTNLTSSQSGAVGGSMSQLDLVKYNFGVETVEGEDQRVEGGQFEGYFKADVDEDPMHDKHRGKWVGMPKNNPEFGKRNRAMYALNKLLGAGVIPPTFAARHEDKAGIVMEKVEGVVGEKADAGALNNPIVRQALSKLYLLDIIAAQVDRHNGNYVVMMEDGVIKGAQGIDNDLSFGKDYDIAELEQYTMPGMNPAFRGTIGPLPKEMNEIDGPFAQKIVDLSQQPATVRGALTGLISDDEIAATLARLNRLTAFLQPLLGRNDGRIVTEWK